MKNSQIAIIIAIAVLIGYTLVRLGNSSTYSTFEQATASMGEKTTVIGYLDADQPMDFNPKTITLTFIAKDKKGNESTVIYHQPKPQDFERSEEITMTGYASDSAFIATDILMKCPSKYNEQNEVQSDKIYK
ncbi:MAG: cytochrome c maturation protein CcmE [Flavobacteriales bacterium]|jgi:cytochrome c-type biogenesis protein CcmE|tara:strand:+ start:118 stop:513 length:396 start_codon:yes stop_codon:yes gene_type:complete